MANLSPGHPGYKFFVSHSSWSQDKITSGGSRMNRDSKIELVQAEGHSNVPVITYSLHGLPSLDALPRSTDQNWEVEQMNINNGQGNTKDRLTSHSEPLSSSAGFSPLPKRKRTPSESGSCAPNNAKPEKRAKVSEICTELVSTSPLQVNVYENQENLFVLDTLQVYLKDRHGFHIGMGEIWNPSNHEENKFTLGRKDHAVAAKILLHHNAKLSEQEFDSTIDCFNTAVNPAMTYCTLPKPWELGIYLLGVPYLDMSKVVVNRVEVDAVVTYILRPATESTDTSPWFIVVSSATAVLEVYRKKWDTMVMIAREFLARGIPFRTVVERDSPPHQSPTMENSQGMGNWPKRYILTAFDYATYQHARANVFSSRRGRVLRMLGGIVGRLALEAVPDVNILNGPSICDEVVLRYGDRYLLDDGISEETLEIVSGVHHVLQPSGKYTRHESYWPKHFTWKSSGMWGDQWSPAAEAFYQGQLQILSTDPRTTKRSAEWKISLRAYKSKTTAFIKGSEGLADQFIQECTRVH